MCIRWADVLNISEYTISNRPVPLQFETRQKFLLFKNEKYE